MSYGKADPPSSSAKPHLAIRNPSEWIIRFAPLVREGGPVLDLAAGGGRHGRYFLERGHPVTLVEWSDWRNGQFWWIQSVYVEKSFRRKGVYREMYRFVKKLASSQPDICGFRLYVEKDNLIAQQTYRSLNMEETPYLLFEEELPRTE